MDLMSGYKNRVQGVVGLVFGNENSASSEDSYVERLLDRISNGVLSEDRRTAIAELQSVVAESRAAQLDFGAMGFPVLLSVLKEERDDVEMVRGALETLVSALTPIDHAKGSKNEVQPALMNTDLLSREAESISLLLSLLSEEDFYIRYYTLQLLTALLTNSPNRLQEAILTIPRGITRLMDMLMDREVIRNEALLLLTYLTREAEEIQKIVVFEGAFEKIFSIVKEEGGSEGGVVVQDCLELLNNLIHDNVSNQVLLRETMGFDPLLSILKLRGNSYSFTQQKELYEKGARKFGFLSLSPLGCLPALRAANPKGNEEGGCFEEACALALAHNNALKAVLTSLEHLFKGFKYCNSNFYVWLEDRINNPSKYGFKEGLNACCGTGPFRGLFTCGGTKKVTDYQLCDNADDYVWWDSFHPTEDP